MYFHETKMGHIFFEHQLPQLIDAINALTASLSKSVTPAVLPAAADPEFLHDLFFGNYEPEIYKVTPELQWFDQGVNQARGPLAKTLSHKSERQLEEYEAALAARNIAVTEQAYRAGIHAAVQMILAGLTCPEAKHLEKAEAEHEH